jgi:hypothetical protein
MKAAASATTNNYMGSRDTYSFAPIINTKELSKKDIDELYRGWDRWMGAKTH